VKYGSIVRYVWTFGDGQSSTTGSPVVTHVYAAAGNYTATVTETDTAGNGVPPAGGTAGRFAVDGPGQTAYRSTNPAAATSAPVGIAPPGTPPPPPPTTTTPTTQPSTTTPTTQTTTSTPTTSTTAPAQPGNPQLKLSPIVATPGELVTVTGTGFPRNTDVTIKWSVSVGSLVVHSDPSGTLPPRQLILLTPDLLGPRFAEAVGTTAKAKLLVVPGTSEPGGSDRSYLFRSEGP
jgi:PKD domain